ncbi:hypothetical protein ELQ92_05380 [Labedella populi]|uniref:Uncharacterized protein n=1 Tax=Labedella populi TaxID=2498850 RepID=A0A3S3ZX87_9MICO|nr:hypothetical protein [Labedella populi]RWZ68632.1 hypothetical protein ELQ92_05380 [Labedella populi]
MTTVILTAAVTPSVTDHLVVNDPGTRLRQYRSSLEAWRAAADASGFALAVVETSGAAENDVTHGIAGSTEIRFESYTPSDDEILRGKGAIETAALGHFLASASLPDEETVYKCTGRLSVANANRVISPLAEATLRGRMTLDRSWIDTRLVGASLDVWRDIVIPAGRSVDDRVDQPIEKELVVHAASRLAGGSLSWDRFPERPFFEGISGTSGRPYSASRSRLSNLLLARIENHLVRLAARKQA